ncbi:unnamed protein product [Cuscuta epithymum]|uniref:Ty3 transposon capsid-like protein domain-containing protein n=1 Tax=Cuscuta epithymum TaxID=186058 RepID=A0AAV0C120_9ASTE|nr:unnamed protein product [Cuscuta epithymum]
MPDKSDSPFDPSNLSHLFEKFECHLSEQLANQEARLQSQIEEQIHALTATLEARLQMSSGRDTALRVGEPSRHTHSGPSVMGFPVCLPTMKLDVLRFSGDDPQQWIFNIQEYFNFHKTPEDQRLQVAGFCLEKEASKWYRWTKRNNMLFGWHDFLEKLQQRFSTTHFVDHQAELAKLTQKGTVIDYQAEFERHMNKVTGIQESLLISFFIGGLRPNLKRELLISAPQTLLEAFKLAKAFETRHEDNSGDNRPQTKGWALKEPFSFQGHPPQGTAPSSTHGSRTTAGTDRGLVPTPSPSIRKMSAMEVQSRCEKGLCFYCDQKYSPGHKCCSKLQILIGADCEDEDPSPNTCVSEETDGLEDIEGDISILNTLSGQGIPRSLRIMGQVRQKPCVVLIDSGSTHNFINHPSSRASNCHSKQPSPSKFVSVTGTLYYANTTVLTSWWSYRVLNLL